MSFSYFSLIYVIDSGIRSDSVHLSFFALAALIQFSLNELHLLHDSVYSPLAADGRIFHLKNLANSLGEQYAEKKYCLALLDLGKAAFISLTSDKLWNEGFHLSRSEFRRFWEDFEDERKRIIVTLREELMEIISLQLERYGSSCFNYKLPKNRFRDHSTTSSHVTVLFPIVGKAFIIFAKAVRFLLPIFEWYPPRPDAWSIVETAYYTINFLIWTINRLRVEAKDEQCTAPHHHRLFLSTLFDWFSTVSKKLFLRASICPEACSLDEILAFGMLFDPFCVYVLLLTFVDFSLISYNDHFLSIVALMKVGSDRHSRNLPYSGLFMTSKPYPEDHGACMRYRIHQLYIVISQPSYPIHFYSYPLPTNLQEKLRTLHRDSNILSLNFSRRNGRESS